MSKIIFTRSAISLRRACASMQVEALQRPVMSKQADNHFVISSEVNTSSAIGGSHKWSRIFCIILHFNRILLYSWGGDVYIDGELFQIPWGSCH